MKSSRLVFLAVVVLQASCASVAEKGSIGQLRRVQLDLSDEQIVGGIEKAMAGYQRFLEETPESAMTPEAIRRLADLKIEKEYGILESRDVAPRSAPDAPAAMASPESAFVAGRESQAVAATAGEQESQDDFEARTTQSVGVDYSDSAGSIEAIDELANQGAEEAIALYQQLLEQYPDYERNDQVLYQMSRAYEELGRVDDAIEVMGRIVASYPHSRHIDEVQFRRGEYFFTRSRFLNAEEAYLAITEMGASSFYYELALYKLGWTFYKQDMLEEGVNQFVGLLDYKVQTGYDFDKPEDDFEQKRIEDTHRVISLSFSAMGGPESVVDYFEKYGSRSYEVDIYRNLGEHYLDKRRYSDAASAYKTFVGLNPYHRVSPHFDMRVIEIYKQGGFPQLIIEANKDFATSYGLKSDYWKHFEVSAFPDVLALLKANLQELAHYYHALYQNPAFDTDKADNFAEAQHWYHEFLDSFPQEEESPAMNYQLADLLLENKSFAAAAQEYERTAYGYPRHEQAAAAGYAAVYAHREQLAQSDEAEQVVVKGEVIRSSLRFADTFPEHERASLVMGAALDDIFAMRNYDFAVTTGRKLLAMFPAAPATEHRSAWLVVAHSSFELSQYVDAEEGYLNVLQLTDAQHESRAELTENLAASIYKQGELANAAADYQLAADHFLRLGQVAPDSALRPGAEYDAATALIELQDWDRSAAVLSGFRSNWPDHELQADVTKRLAHVYGESGQLAQAAAEYERIERESDDESVRREALKIAADLYLQVDDQAQAVQIYRRFIRNFPAPLEPVVEMHYSIAQILKEQGDTAAWHQELQHIVDADARAGEQSSNRMRYLAGTSALLLTEPMFDEFAQIQLSQPFENSLLRKRNAMRAANAAFGKLVDYEIGEVTAAATYYIAEIYYNFGRALMDSERPGGLDDLEMQQYEDMLDEQAYPFEEQAITIHEKNVGFIDIGVYNDWVDKSIVRLASVVPGRYARFEESSGFIAAIDTNDYSHLTEPKLPEPAEPEGVVDVDDTAAADGDEPADSAAPAPQDGDAELPVDDEAEEGEETQVPPAPEQEPSAENEEIAQLVES